MSRTKATVQLVALTLGVVAIPIAASAAAAAGPPLPAWPQTFYVNALEPHGFGLPVTTAGTITVSVHAQGAPIIVTLARSDGTLAQQVAGTADLRLSYVASPAEVAGSPLWHIGIALQQPASGAEASGSVQVQEPPIDTRKLAAFLAQSRPPGVPPDAAARAALAKQDQAKIDATKHEFEQARAARQAARFEAIRPRLEEAKARAAQAVSTRSVGPPTAVLAAPNVMRAPVMQPLPITRPAPPPPPPVITLPLLVDPVEPGDTIPIAGSGFGAQGPGSAVHFVLGIQPTDDHTAPITTWNNGEILATVPMVQGYFALTGTLYVVRADGAISQYIPFHFLPTVDLRTYPLPPQSPADSLIGNYDGSWCQWLVTDTEAATSNSPGTWFPLNGWAPWAGFANAPIPLTWMPCDGSGSWVSGYKSNDIFFQTAQLKNGWVLDHVDLTFVSQHGCNQGAYVSQADPPAIGTSSPRVDVRVWLDACPVYPDNPMYLLDIYVKGPLGVPFQ